MRATMFKMLKLCCLHYNRETAVIARRLFPYFIVLVDGEYNGSASTESSHFLPLSRSPVADEATSPAIRSSSESSSLSFLKRWCPASSAGKVRQCRMHRMVLLKSRMVHRPKAKK